MWEWGTRAAQVIAGFVAQHLRWEGERCARLIHKDSPVCCFYSLLHEAHTGKVQLSGMLFHHLLHFETRRGYLQEQLCPLCYVLLCLQLTLPISDAAGNANGAKGMSATAGQYCVCLGDAEAPMCFLQGQSRRAGPTNPSRILSAGFGLASLDALPLLEAFDPDCALAWAAASSSVSPS